MAFINNDDITSPATRMWLLTRSDTIAINPLPRAIRFNADGTVVLRALNSEADITLTVTAGELLPIRAQFIRLTGTDNIVMHGLA